MRLSVPAVLLAAAAVARAADDPSPATHAPACTATSSTGSGAFFDLRPDTAVLPDKSKGKSHKAGVAKDYHSKGYDYGKNFTMNICGPVVDPVSDVVGLDKNAWANVSAYYMSHGNIYSIGSVQRAADGCLCALTARQVSVDGPAQPRAQARPAVHGRLSLRDEAG